jgi:hypothetical protein|nr:hypothetical protein [Candidatus Krumholzibacteria bacterium]
MKKIFISMMIAASLALLAGCGDDDNPANPGGGDDNNFDGGTITATLDGTAVDFSENAAGVDEDPGWYTFAGGNQGAGETIIVTLPAATGTYGLGDPGDPSIQLVYNSMAWFAVSGTLTVSSVSDDDIAGTFAGTFEDIMSNTLVLTAGSFDVPIVRAP